MLLILLKSVLKTRQRRNIFKIRMIFRLLVVLFLGLALIVVCSGFEFSLLLNYNFLNLIILGSFLFSFMVGATYSIVDLNILPYLILPIKKKVTIKFYVASEILDYVFICVLLLDIISLNIFQNANAKFDFLMTILIILTLVFARLVGMSINLIIKNPIRLLATSTAIIALLILLVKNLPPLVDINNYEIIQVIVLTLILITITFRFNSILLLRRLFN